MREPTSHLAKVRVTSRTRGMKVKGGDWKGWEGKDVVWERKGHKMVRRL